MSRISKPNIRPIMMTEMAAAFIIASILVLFSQIEVAKSIIIGFVCFFLPNIFFTLRVWRYTGAKYARQVARSFYVAEAGKYSLTIVCFALSFKLAQPFNVAILFTSYVVFLMSHQMALFKLR
ncbi:MAG: ATP synthase subunit I [Sinobacterium sp.]|nr:ATP synthase subunit I [Sinobacterium sp.]